MPPRLSAGLVIYRVHNSHLEVFLAHPGGPYFSHKDEGHWSIPKGEPEPGEEMLQTAIREVREEVGIRIDPGAIFIPLGSIRQKGGKIVHAWAVQAPHAVPDWDKAQTVQLEWPPDSGRFTQFQEVDQAAFFPLANAVQKIKPTQIPLLERLAEQLRVKQCEFGGPKH